MKKKENKARNVYTTMGIVALSFLLVLVTYIFTNYTKSNTMNNASYGRISYDFTPIDSITLTNIFPINSSQLVDDLNNHGTITLTITGRTNYDVGAEYVVKLDQVDNMINDKSIPITYHAAVSNLGEEVDDYFNNRNLDKNLYQVKESGDVYSNERVVVGYIRKGETNFNGTISLTAYVDAERIGIYSGDGETFTDDSDESGVVIPEYYYKRDDEGITVFTPEEWEEINERGMSFKVRVDVKEGIWITNE